MLREVVIDFAKKIQKSKTKQIGTDYCVLDNSINFVINVCRLFKSEFPQTFDLVETLQRNDLLVILSHCNVSSLKTR